MRQRIPVFLAIAIIAFMLTGTTQAATSFNPATMGVWPDNPVAHTLIVDDVAIAATDQMDQRQMNFADNWACTCRTVLVGTPANPVTGPTWPVTSDKGLPIAEGVGRSGLA